MRGRHAPRPQTESEVGQDALLRQAGALEVAGDRLLHPLHATEERYGLAKVRLHLWQHVLHVAGVPGPRGAPRLRDHLVDFHALRAPGIEFVGEAEGVGTAGTEEENDAAVGVPAFEQI